MVSAGYSIIEAIVNSLPTMPKNPDGRYTTDEAIVNSPPTMPKDSGCSYKTNSTTLSYLMAAAGTRYDSSLLINIGCKPIKRVRLF
jgi:hypothetical protein